MNTTKCSWISGLSFAAAMVLIAGCNTVNTVERAQPVGQKQMVADKRVITSAALNWKVRIIAVNETTISTGFTKVQIELMNNSRSAYRFRYHFEWFDDKGILIQSPTSSWVDRSILGKEAMSIIAVAPTEAAKDFRVNFIPH